MIFLFSKSWWYNLSIKYNVKKRAPHQKTRQHNLWIVTELSVSELFLPAVYNIFLHPGKRRNKCHISVRKADFSDTSWESNTNIFPSFSAIMERTYERMDIFVRQDLLPIYCYIPANFSNSVLSIDFKGSGEFTNKFKTPQIPNARCYRN